jgi:hypothetical protein
MGVTEPVSNGIRGNLLFEAASTAEPVTAAVKASMQVVKQEITRIASSAIS